MKKLLAMLIVTLCLVSCSKSDIEKANELITQYGLVVAPVNNLDSLNYFSDCLEYRIKSAQITHEADSTLSAGVKTAQMMKDNGYTELESYAQRLQEDVVAMYQIAYKYTQDANFGEFQHNLSKDPTEFLGYKCEVANDSLSYVVVFNPEMSKILMVEKKKK